MSMIFLELVHELLRYKPSSIPATKVFVNLRHNEHLCPTLERQGNRILDCFVRYHSVIYDVQGINDQGSDVRLVYFVKSENSESKKRLISFQIKSFEDLNAKEYLRDLKAQCIEAITAFGENLDHHYILLCTNKEAHKNKIRQIKNAFSNNKYITVIDPTYALTFLRLSTLRISSVVSSLLREDDSVYDAALKILMDFAPTEIAIFLAAVYDATVSRKSKLDIDKLMNSNFIIDIFNSVPDYPRDYFESFLDIGLDNKIIVDKPKDMCRDIKARFAEGVEYLEGALFSYDGDSHEIEIDFDYCLPIQAVIMESLVRYGYQGDLLLTYLFDSFRILENFSIDFPEETDNWVENL